jgi:hypothetical protein
MPVNKRGNDMQIKYFAAALVLMSLLDAESRAQEGPVTWSDPTCGFFVVQLPPGDPADAFGLYSWKVHPGPQVGDVVEGENMAAAKELVLVNQRSGDKHVVIHWANAKAAEMLIRNTPVQCASKWKKKKK